MGNLVTPKTSADSIVLAGDDSSLYTGFEYYMHRDWHGKVKDNGRGPYVTTYTGRFYPMSPSPNNFTIEDVAHSLAQSARYGGAGREFYSTAEHSVLLTWWLRGNGYDAKTQLAALLHDAPEALSGMGDQQRPMKTDYCRHVEDRIWREAIAVKFNLPLEIPAIVHEIDGRIIADEMAQNCHERDPQHDNPLGMPLYCWTWQKAELIFMDEFNRLMREAMN